MKNQLHFFLSIQLEQKLPKEIKTHTRNPIQAQSRATQQPIPQELEYEGNLEKERLTKYKYGEK